MKVLGIDTATRIASAAVLDGGRVVAEATSQEGEARPGGRGNHAETLIPLIDAVLQKAAVACEQLDAIAVSIGPGSFTGIRIGLSVAKGLAYQGAAAVVGVPTLAAIAARVDDWESLICPLLDARKGEVYAGLFSRRGRDLERLSEDAVEPVAATIEKVLAQSGAQPCLFVGDGVRMYGELIRRALGEKALLSSGDRYVSTAASVARLGQARIETCGRDSLESLAPLYLRPAEAEFSRR
ncbi:MAG TPA: tRNA (adenosine(37)-N6)-threonylcarbamoyltransferase complex dimerization subunit type 1 TsaB [Candidatus Acidoferrales bacterium]|nr:tRNA (adenosine(37)-N6)-threonylcarbamoyltransferase complex dimerization subunit type 1 TsaB [Candidatus Acidoferrales bacterium]